MTQTRSHAERRNEKLRGVADGGGSVLDCGLVDHVPVTAFLVEQASEPGIGIVAALQAASGDQQGDEGLAVDEFAFAVAGCGGGAEMRGGGVLRHLPADLFGRGSQFNSVEPANLLW